MLNSIQLKLTGYKKVIKSINVFLCSFGILLGISGLTTIPIFHQYWDFGKGADLLFFSVVILVLIVHSIATLFYFRNDIKGWYNYVLFGTSFIYFLQAIVALSIITISSVYVDIAQEGFGKGFETANFETKYEMVFMVIQEHMFVTYEEINKKLEIAFKNDLGFYMFVLLPFIFSMYVTVSNHFTFKIK